MKTAIRSFVLIVIGILSILICLTLNQKDIKTYELQTIVDQAMSETQRVLYDKRYPINSNDEYLAEFTQNLVRNTSSLSDLKIDVYGIDYEKGLLDVEISSSFRNVTGQTKTLKLRKTSIIDVINESGT